MPNVTKKSSSFYSRSKMSVKKSYTRQHILKYLANEYGTRSAISRLDNAILREKITLVSRNGLHSSHDVFLVNQEF